MVEVTAGGLAVPAGAAFGVLNFSGGTLSGAFTVTGTLTWTGGTLAGQITVASGSVLNLPGAEQKSLAYPAEIHNHGTVNWSGAGTVQNVTGNGVLVRNYSDGVVTITADAGLGGAGQFINEGLLTKSGTAGTTTLALGPFTNTGVVHVTVGP